MSAVDAIARRVRKAPPSILIAGTLLVLFVVLALLAPLIAPHDPMRQSLLQRLRPPGHSTAGGLTYLFGTDDLGMLAAWYRRSVEIVIMRLVDTMLSIPAILLAVLAVAVVGPSFTTLIAVLGFTRWPRYTRVAYAQTLQVATLPYIRAAELAGAGTLRILTRHILPNIAGPLVVVATAEFGLMILFEAGLSFLGLGIQPPTPSWGSILSAGRQYVERAPWLTILPGACLFALVLSVNVFGDYLRDLLDPRSRVR